MRVIDYWQELDEPEEPAWRRVARVAATPPLRDYIAARLIDMVGRWMLRFTNSLVVWELTRDYHMVALTVVAQLLPGLIFELVGGVMADRMDRRHVLMVSNVVGAAGTLALAVLAFTGLLTTALMFSLLLVQGAVHAFSHSASKTIVTQFVPKTQLATAVSLNAVVFNVAGFFGPALAGIVYAGFGAPASYLCCVVCAMTFVYMLRGVPPMPPEAGANAHQSILKGLQAALAYVLAARFVGLLFVLHMACAALARPFLDFVPGHVEQVLSGGPDQVAKIMSAVGVGSVFGGLWVASRTTRRELIAVALGAMPAFCLAMVAFAWCQAFWLSLVFAFLVGFGIITRGSATQSLLQLETNPGYRGRVVALYGVTMDVGALVGAFLIGKLAALLGISMSLTISILLALAIWLWLRDRLPRAGREHTSMA